MLETPVFFKQGDLAAKKKFEAVDGQRHRLGEYLVEHGLVHPDAVNAAILEQQVNGDRLGMILVRNGFLSHKDLVTAILHVSSDRISKEKINRSRIPAEVLEKHSIILSAETEERIFVSTMGNEMIARGIVRQYYPEKEIVFTAFIPDNMAEFVERIERTSNLGDTSTADSVLDKLLYRALAEGASDVHIIPRLKSYTVMFRFLGVRRIVHEGDLEEYLIVVSRAKDRARMDMAEKRIPQDGGFNIDYNGKLVDMRVATVPAVDGEIVVMRVLDPDRVHPRLDGLGITRLDHWRRGFNQQNGLCLICGPTGSGKTTTLNASIRELDRFGKAVYSAEDPVEYKIPYTGQVSMNPTVGLDFAQSVRSFMRADPDVIVLGEVRDPETARNAVKAADTGHLVMATLHTGSILGALSRLRDLEVPSHELRYLLRAVLVQSLVRTICTHCQGEGCIACGGTGYSQRTIVSECTSFRDYQDVDKAIDGEISWPSMFEDAVGKYREGLTTLDELRRVFGSLVENIEEQE